jgi:uncharacterized delta-60 repeat protein
MKSLWFAVRLAAVSSIFLCSFAHSIVGQPGTLDQSFATSSPQGAGKARLIMTPNDDYVRATALQTDGKFLLAGECGSNSGNTVCVARYSADGTVDNAWGTNGKAFASVGQFGVNVVGAALQSSGSLLVLSSCQPEGATAQSFCIVRFSSIGVIDASWGEAGLAHVAMVSRGVTAGAIIVDSSDRVYVGGSCTIDFGDTDFCAARFTASGVLDTRWATLGKTIARLSNLVEQVNAIALRPSGELLLAGECSLPAGWSMCSAQLTANGSLDQSWGTSGFAVTAIANNSSGAKALHMLADGRALLVGSCFNGTINGMCTAMLNTAGALSSAWNTTGYTIAAGASGTGANALTRQADGKWVIGGGCSTGLSNSFCTWRYKSDGTLDRSFGIDGKSVVNIGLADGVTGIAIQAVDERILLGGYCGGGLSTDFCVARLDAGFSPGANCALDVDGDGEILSTTDSLLQLRIARGSFGPALTGGMAFSAQAQRTTWETIREYLRENPADLDGDGRVMPETDGVMHTRIALGFIGSAVVEGIVFPEFAPRQDWTAIAAYIASRCGIPATANS